MFKRLRLGLKFKFYYRVARVVNKIGKNMYGEKTWARYVLKDMAKHQGKLVSCSVDGSDALVRLEFTEASTTLDDAISFADTVCGTTIMLTDINYVVFIALDAYEEKIFKYRLDRETLIANNWGGRSLSWIK